MELLERQGSEMTAAPGVCRHCDTPAVVAELSVYPGGPSAVARCRTCGWVTIVIVHVRGELRVDMSWFALSTPPPRAL